MMVLLYYLLLKPLSYLPLPVLYRISDLLCLILNKGIGYRKKVVITNLKNSFPDKNEAEIEEIASRFYRHLCDLIVESVRIFSISEEEATRRCVLKDPGLFQRLFNEGKNLIIVGGHYNNWELSAVAFDPQVPYQTYGLYSPLRSAFMEREMSVSRQKFGMKLVPKKQVKSVFETEHQKPYACIFGADQWPGASKNVYWMQFLNQETAVAFGTEKYGKAHNAVIVYGAINKIRRGYYELDFTVMEAEPTSSYYGHITQKHTCWLEKQILNEPAYWLWSHKRWKHKREAGEELHRTMED